MFFRNFVLLKKVFIISLLFVYLFSATEFRELLKFPDMLEHYKEHKQKNNAISFFDFINMHYSGPHDDDGDSDKDMNLPFKSHDNCMAVNNNLLASNSLPAYTIKPVETNLNKLNISQVHFSPSSYQVNIWQPPKA